MVVREGVSASVNPSLRVALTLEQSWHRVPGGTGVAALGMAKGLARRADVDPIGVAALHRGPAPDAWRPSIRVRHLPLPRLALYESWHRLRIPKVQRATGQVDVIHATSFAVPPRSAPLVVTVHDLAFLNDPSHFTRRGLRFFDRALRLVRDQADLIVCPSEATLHDCIKNGLDERRLRLVPMGVEMEVADEDAVRSIRARYGLDRPYVMWTGTIEPRKNLPRLLEAFSRLDTDRDLVLVGPKGWNEDLGALVRGSADRVKALGFVPYPDLGPLYAGADVFCFPSLFEGFGLPVLEAMSQGTAVVTSRKTSTEEIAGDAGVLVEPTDVASIAEGLGSLLEDDSRRAELAQAGRERAAAYTWDATAAMLSEVYREACS
jgi:glycosyltransferase involved in cell wall biosynthesis